MGENVKIQLASIESKYRLVYMCEACKHVQVDNNNGICEACGEVGTAPFVGRRTSYYASKQWELKKPFYIKETT